MYEIDKREASWLAKALGKNKLNSKLMYANVVKRYGQQLAGATDGHRLHAVETTAPEGVYQIDVQGGKLIPVMHEGFDWSVIVGIEHPEFLSLRPNQDNPYAVELLTANGAPCVVDKTFFWDAVDLDYPYTIRAHAHHRGTIRIDIRSGDHIQYAILMMMPILALAGAK